MNSAWRLLKKGVFYTVSVSSTMYCTLRFGGSIGVCEDISMEPTIQHGDMVLISPLPVNFMKLQKGDVVFCKSPRNAANIFCKRIVGMEYDTIYNSEEEYEEYLNKGHVWLEGDNKVMSIDSRKYGQIPYGLIISKVVLRIWPLNRIGWLNLPDEETPKKSLSSAIQNQISGSVLLMNNGSSDTLDSNISTEDKIKGDDSFDVNSILK